MDSVGRVIESSTLELDPATFVLPNIYADILTGLGKVRNVWRWYDKTKLYSGHPGKIAGGIVSNIALGYYEETSRLGAMSATIIRVAAHFVLVVSRISDVVESKRTLSESYTKWRHAVMCTYQVSSAAGGTVGMYSNTTSMLSASTVGYVSTTVHTNILWIQDVAARTFELISCSFTFSMRFMDAVEAFSSSPRVRDDAMNEFFIHSRKAVDALAENKPQLLEKLYSNREAIDKIIKRVGFWWSADDLITVASNVLSAPQQGLNKMDQVADSALSVLKKTTYAPMNAFLGTAPNNLLPNDMVNLLPSIQAG